MSEGELFKQMSSDMVAQIAKQDTGPIVVATPDEPCCMIDTNPVSSPPAIAKEITKQARPSVTKRK